MTCLLDLPEEILREVIVYSDRRYPWLLVAQATCCLAGETIYAQGVQSWEKPPPLLSLLRGIEDRAESADDPFDNLLKLRFLAHVRKLNHDGPLRLHALSQLRSCLTGIPSDLVVFPRLDSLVLGGNALPSAHPLAPMVSEVSRRLVAISRPRHLCFVARDWCHGSPFCEGGIIPHNDRLESVTIHVKDLAARPVVPGGSKRYKIAFGLDVCLASTDITARIRWIAACIATQPDAEWTVENAAQIRTAENSVTCYEPLTARLIKEGLRKQFRQPINVSFPHIYSMGPKRCEACNKWT